MTDHLEKARELGETLVAQETATGTNSTTDSISLAILAHVALAEIEKPEKPAARKAPAKKGKN